MLPNVNQTQSLIRSLVIAFGSYAVGNGWITGDQLVQWSPIVLAAGAAIWGLFASTKKAVVAKAADIVKIPVTQQAAVGITKPIVEPKSPKVGGVV